MVLGEKTRRYNLIERINIMERNKDWPQKNAIDEKNPTN